MIQLSFHGGAGTVTGSKHRINVNGEEVLIDCGMFQGLKELRERNWTTPPFDVATFKNLVLTHAHLDHTGWLPRMVHLGFKGKIYATAGTRDVAEIILKDSAHLQEEEAEFRNKKGISSHGKALPLYTVEDVEQTMPLFQTVEYGAWTQVSPSISFRMVDVGHILGSAAVEFKLVDGGRTVRVLASGDVGRYDMPLHPDPEDAPPCDALLLESTYGDRDHVPERPEEQLLRVVKLAIDSGGVVLIPAFAVGRSQQVIFVLNELFRTGKLPRIPIFLDSPMGINATKLYVEYASRYRFDAETLRGGVCTLYDGGVKTIKTAAESMRLAELKGPAVVISSNGMLTGGRILHHLKNFLPNPRNIVAIVGYQAIGSRGRMLQDGAKELSLFHEMVPVRARIEDLKGFSGHADAGELMRWTKHVEPKKCFLVHGEPQAAEFLAQRIRRERHWDVHVAKLDETVDL
ncbi:MAG: MBL fold metallo-hydrolase [Elusimicrobia bacterium]|nr:MBL fold metallo-hydrolase [Elusimicrobiota bacterium]